MRLDVEDRLKDGELRAVVCSTSLEMGIDIGAVDLVVMVATPKGVSRAIQRIGRSGHSLNRNSHGMLVATNMNDLVEATVTARRVRERALDPIRVQRQPVDVIAQHIVGLAASAPIAADEAFALIRRAYPFSELTREEFDRIVEYLEGGGASLRKQYAGLFGKIRVDDGVISLAHPRVAREFLVNIGTIVSESFVDVFLRRRRLGSVEENFIKQLQIGDLFVLGGRIVRLIETGVQAAYVERADGHLPTVPRWNAAKMPLTSGLARRSPQFADATSETQLTQSRNERGARVDWLVENYEISIANAEAILEQFRAQLSISELPVGEKMLIELYREGDHSHYFFHSLIGRSANDALSRIVAWRVKNRIGGNALVTIDDYGFLLTLRPFQEMPLEDWRLCFEREGAEEDLSAALRGSELVKWQFRGVAQTGLMVPRHLPGRERRPKQLTWSSEVLFRVLEQHEPRSSAAERGVSPGDAHVPRRRGSVCVSRRRAGVPLEVARAAGCVAVLVRDLREQDQGEHDAGGSRRSDRANLRRDVCAGRERGFARMLVIARRTARISRAVSRLRAEEKQEGAGPCDPPLPAT